MTLVPKIQSAVATAAGVIKHHLISVFIALATLAPVASAQELPTVEEPLDGGADGLFEGGLSYAGTIVQIIAFVLIGASFVVVAGTVLAKYSEAQKRGEWGGFVGTAVLGVFVIVFVIWLGNQAVEVFA